MQKWLDTFMKAGKSITTIFNIPISIKCDVSKPKYRKEVVLKMLCKNNVTTNEYKESK